MNEWNAEHDANCAEEPESMVQGMIQNKFRDLWRKPWSPYGAAFVGAVIFLIFPTVFVVGLKIHGYLSLLSSPAFGVRTAHAANAAEILFTAPPFVGGALGFVLWATFRGIRRTRLRRAGKIITAVGALVGAVAASFFLVGAAFNSWLNYHYGVPSDARLMADFRRDELALERLRLMLARIPEPARIDSGGYEDYNLTPHLSRSASPEKARYQTALDAAGVVQCTGSKDSAEFPVWLEGWAIADGEEKGFCYLKTPPKPLRSSLDGIVIPYAVTYSGYRHITGNWYLYYSHTSG